MSVRHLHCPSPHQHKGDGVDHITTTHEDSEGYGGMVDTIFVLTRANALQMPYRHLRYWLLKYGTLINPHFGNSLHADGLGMQLQQ